MEQVSLPGNQSVDAVPIAVEGALEGVFLWAYGGHGLLAHVDVGRKLVVLAFAVFRFHSFLEIAEVSLRAYQVGSLLRAASLHVGYAAAADDGHGVAFKVALSGYPAPLVAALAQGIQLGK